MKMKKFGGTESRIYDMVYPIAEENGLIVWDVRFEKEGAMWYLRVMLDHMERPVNIADCEAVTRPLNKLLDDTDPIQQTYTLEVGSAGLERELIRETHFDACEGSKVRVRMIRPLENGQKEIVGTLTGADHENVRILTEDAEASMELPLAGIAFVKLADFDEAEVQKAEKD
ncbi:MAG: ribosome maturation factor RimP [Oscillospiraceae bacterium]|nr:ribosome maturation factor RimP [Oscillospiraceae bacterium]